MSHREIVAGYFEAHDSEYLDFDRTEINLPISGAIGAADSPQASTPPDLESVADKLQSGATSDIWYDAHEYDAPEDVVAENQIEVTQQAMFRAAEILRDLARAPHGAHAAPLSAPHKSVPNLAEAFLNGETIVWLSDREGNPTPESVSTPGPRTRFDQAVIPSRYAAGHEFNAGRTARFRGRNHHVISVDFQWGVDLAYDQDNAFHDWVSLGDTVRASVVALGGIVIPDADATDNCHRLYILLPLDIAEAAASHNDYLNAVDYLINSAFPDDPKSVFADFRPQVWQNDYANPADPEGDTRYDVTFEILAMGSKNSELMLADCCDQLKDAHLAPDWIKERAGLPFEIDVDAEDVEELFKLFS